jgi:hypothetical protein
MKTPLSMVFSHWRRNAYIEIRPKLWRIMFKGKGHRTSVLEDAGEDIPGSLRLRWILNVASDIMARLT